MPGVLSNTTAHKKGNRLAIDSWANRQEFPHLFCASGYDSTRRPFYRGRQSC